MGVFFKWKFLPPRCHDSARISAACGAAPASAEAPGLRVSMIMLGGLATMIAAMPAAAHAAVQVAANRE